jgi:hypothetical protein
MSYFKRVRTPAPRPAIRRRGLLGMGDYSDSTQCSEIPLGDPYRKPGNYCATPDGGMTTFNADGSTYRAPGYAVDPDPAHPAGSPPGAPTSSDSGTGILSAIAKAFGAGLAPQPAVIMPAQSGMSTTTLLALAGAGVLAAVLLARRS